MSRYTGRGKRLRLLSRAVLTVLLAAALVAAVGLLTVPVLGGCL